MKHPNIHHLDLDTPRAATRTRFASWRGEEKPWGDSESRQMLEQAIENGRGGRYLRLTPEQYAKLRRP